MNFSLKYCIWEEIESVLNAVSISERASGIMSSLVTHSILHPPTPEPEIINQKSGFHITQIPTSPCLRS